MRHKYSNGEDPDEVQARRTADYSAHNINIIPNFTKLRVLHLYKAPLNGTYPVLFSFPLLEKISILGCQYLKCDLEMLQGLTSLKELDLNWNRNSLPTGNLSSLGALKNSLEKVRIDGCPKIFGNFMDLADFPRLKKLDLNSTTVTVTGDIRDIGRNDFSALESLALPDTVHVHGGTEYKFQRISDVPIFMHTIHLLLQRIPTLFVNSSLSGAFSWSVSEGSPDWYEWEVDAWGDDYPLPPFDLQIVQAGLGSRRGWSWRSNDGPSCEVNWLDPEPSNENSDYEAYIEDLQRIEQDIDFYREYHEPPTEQQ